MDSEIKRRIAQIRRGEVPEGYKKGKLGIVPEEWTDTSFSTLFTSTSDYTDDLDKYPLYSLTIEEGVTPKTERYERSHLVKKEDSYKIVRPNDYAYNPILTFVAVFVFDRNLLFRVANYLKISYRSDNNAVWDYMFDYQPWIVVRDYITGNVYYGKVVKYSDDHEAKELLLEDVSVWSKKDGHYKMVEVYLSRMPSEFSIEIDDYCKGEDA